MAYVKKKDTTKQEVAYKKIKDAILKNEFKPNTMLNEGNLCKMLGFSKTPIREALRRLFSEGFVEFISEKGTFISKISLEELIEIYDVREALEGMAARLCALRKDEGVINQLKKSIESMLNDLNYGKNRENVKDDIEFHRIIVRGSLNKKLITFSNTMLDQINRFAITTVDDTKRLMVSYEQHEKVYNAIKDGNAEAAEKAIRDHIHNVKGYQIRRHYFINGD
jgi:DNA-binding GntR family transcriptional regulator